MFYNLPLLAQRKHPPRIEVEVDPLAYFLKGYSIHGAITYGSFRSSVGLFAIDQPSFFVNDDAFSVYSSGFDFKTDYLFGRRRGWHSGIQIGDGKERVRLKHTEIEDDIHGINLGVRVGYRIHLRKGEVSPKGPYINPWLALLYSPNASTLVLDNSVYEQSRFFPFPAIHVGWRF